MDLHCREHCMKTRAKIGHDGAEYFQLTAPNGDIYEATRADAQSAWVVCFPAGRFRLFGSRNEVHSKIIRKAHQALGPTSEAG